MTWRGREEALPCRNIEEFVSYLNSLHGGWRPSGIVLHNTASPTLEQWWHGGTPPEQRMKNLRNYYEDDMGWSAGPHAFCDGVTIWIFTDFNVSGVHSPSWNGSRLGIEMVGDYDTESDESGPGKKVMDQTIALFGETLQYYGWPCDNNIIKIHKEDPATDHDCPGKNVVKSEFVDDVDNYMGEGGDHFPGERPQREAVMGVVYNVPPGDTLSIRAAASSSAEKIGEADNGDRVKVVNDSWNGSTRWFELEFEKGGVLVWGWASAAYIKRLMEDTPEPPEPGEEFWHTSITATEFGGEGDEQEGAYGGWIDSSTVGISFPYKWRDQPRPWARVTGPSGTIVAQVCDVGPWNTDDPDYVLGRARPLAEMQYQEGEEAQNGRVPTNDAGIDLTPPVARAVGINGKGKVKWMLVEPTEAEKSRSAKPQKVAQKKSHPRGKVASRGRR